MENIILRNIFPERNVELGTGENDEVWEELKRRNWVKRLTNLPDNNINVGLVKEFSANIYYPEDSFPKHCKVWGKVIKFDAQHLNSFL